MNARFQEKPCPLVSREENLKRHLLAELSQDLSGPPFLPRCGVASPSAQAWPLQALTDVSLRLREAFPGNSSQILCLEQVIENRWVLWFICFFNICIFLFAMMF